MEEITVITCYNDKIKYDAFLETLYAQDIPFAVRGIDNTAKQFPSCASALNYAIKDVKTEYVVFAHQDILLPGCSMLREFLDAMKNSEPGSLRHSAVYSTDRAQKLCTIRAQALTGWWKSRLSMSAFSEERAFILKTIHLMNLSVTAGICMLPSNASEI